MAGFRTNQKLTGQFGSALVGGAGSSTAPAQQPPADGQGDMDYNPGDYGSGADDDYFDQ